MTLDSIRIQKSECPKRTTLCKYCATHVEMGSLVEHENYCGSRTEKCEKCGDFIMLKNFEAHTCLGSMATPAYSAYVSKFGSSSVAGERIGSVANILMAAGRLISNTNISNCYLFLLSSYFAADFEFLCFFIGRFYRNCFCIQCLQFFLQIQLLQQPGKLFQPEVFHHTVLLHYQVSNLQSSCLTWPQTTDHISGRPAHP